ncbi:hypothetical protein BOTBODRAFT_469874 [Botryobasidium botryosum FD-172 SS1]|uniref:Uncharacterized protein n=1 Tax=Botryobasidium botryosum (strain FD-172 SS1) TaxID=930990 RepID=A0A067MGI8_BOTB1|nr:hypothetical protein BOTBODRAFT_469874 [Botryobasidium botryosum FD-172 SS1]
MPTNKRAVMRTYPLTRSRTCTHVRTLTLTHNHVRTRLFSHFLSRIPTHKHGFGWRIGDFELEGRWVRWGGPRACARLFFLAFSFFPPFFLSLY